MKSNVALLLCFIVAGSIADAQFLKGTTELGLGGSLGSYTTKSTSSGLYGNYSNSETKNYAILNLSVGYYVADGLSIEPEISLMAMQGLEPSDLFLVNVSYTMPNPSSKFSPFILVGYGVSNSMQFPGLSILGRVSDKLDVGVLNVGAGIKYLVSEDIALKMELNYRKESFTQTISYFGSSSSSDNTFATTGLLFGFSVLL